MRVAADEAIDDPPLAFDLAVPDYDRVLHLCSLNCCVVAD